jgi:hypothetical protein
MALHDVRGGSLGRTIPSGGGQRRRRRVAGRLDRDAASAFASSSGPLT